MAVSFGGKLGGSFRGGSGSTPSPTPPANDQRSATPPPSIPPATLQGPPTTPLLSRGGPGFTGDTGGVGVRTGPTSAVVPVAFKTPTTSLGFAPGSPGFQRAQVEAQQAQVEGRSPRFTSQFESNRQMIARYESPRPTPRSNIMTSTLTGKSQALGGVDDSRVGVLQTKSATARQPIYQAQPQRNDTTLPYTRTPISERFSEGRIESAARRGEFGPIGDLFASIIEEPSERKTYSLLQSDINKEKGLTQRTKELGSQSSFGVVGGFFSAIGERLEKYDEPITKQVDRFIPQIRRAEEFADTKTTTQEATTTGRVARQVLRAGIGGPAGQVISALPISEESLGRKSSELGKSAIKTVSASIRKPYSELAPQVAIAVITEGTSEGLKQGSIQLYKAGIRSELASGALTKTASRLKAPFEFITSQTGTRAITAAKVVGGTALAAPSVISAATSERPTYEFGLLAGDIAKIGIAAKATRRVFESEAIRQSAYDTPRLIIQQYRGINKIAPKNPEAATILRSALDYQITTRGTPEAPGRLIRGSDLPGPGTARQKNIAAKLLNKPGGVLAGSLPPGARYGTDVGDVDVIGEQKTVEALQRLGVTPDPKAKSLREFRSAAERIEPLQRLEPDGPYTTTISEQVGRKIAGAIGFLEEAGSRPTRGKDFPTGIDLLNRLALERGQDPSKFKIASVEQARAANIPLSPEVRSEIALGNLQSGLDKKFPPLPKRGEIPPGIFRPDAPKPKAQPPTRFTETLLGLEDTARITGFRPLELIPIDSPRGIKQASAKIIEPATPQNTLNVLRTKPTSSKGFNVFLPVRTVAKPSAPSRLPSSASIFGSKPSIIPSSILPSSSGRPSPSGGSGSSGGSGPSRPSPSISRPPSSRASASASSTSTSFSSASSSSSSDSSINIGETIINVEAPIIPFQFPGGGIDLGRRVSRGFGRSKKVYRPTLFASAFNVRGPRSSLGEISGLGIRPIAEGNKKPSMGKFEKNLRKLVGKK